MTVSYRIKFLSAMVCINPPSPVRLILLDGLSYEKYGRFPNAFPAYCGLEITSCDGVPCGGGDPCLLS